VAKTLPNVTKMYNYNYIIRIRLNKNVGNKEQENSKSKGTTMWKVQKEDNSQNTENKKENVSGKAL